MGKELTGFIDICVEAVENSELYIAFDEVINGDTVDIGRLGALNVVKYELEKDAYLKINLYQKCNIISYFS